MDNRYVYVCSVSAGADNDLLYCATIADDVVTEGDFIILDNGVRGFARNISYMYTESTDFVMLSEFAGILHEIVQVYRKWWMKEE